MIESLQGITRLYLDANILIYLVEGDEALSQSVHALLEAADAAHIRLFTSDITLTECLLGPLRAGNNDLAQAYLDLLQSHDFIALVGAELDVCVKASHIGAQCHLKTVDAIHLASAESSGCQALLSNDHGFKNTDNVRVIRLSDCV